MDKKHYTAVSFQVRNTANMNQIRSIILLQNTLSVQEIKYIEL